MKHQRVDRRSLRERMANPSPELARRLVAAESANPVTGSTRAGAPAENSNKLKSGNSLVHNLPRAELIDVPLHLSELANMIVELKRISLGKMKESSLDKQLGHFEHWKSFCARFGLPVYLNTDTLGGVKAAAAQGQLIILYELANF